MAWQRSAPKPRKFVKGPQVLGLFEAVDAVRRGRYMLFMGKPMHPSVICNWSISQIERACRQGVLFHADPNPEHPDNMKDETP